MYTFVTAMVLSGQFSTIFEIGLRLSPISIPVETSFCISTQRKPALTEIICSLKNIPKNVDNFKMLRVFQNSRTFSRIFEH